MEYVDATFLQNYDCGEYYYGIVIALSNRGYERGVHIFGAPYDFRKGPSKRIFLFCFFHQLWPNLPNMNFR